MRHAILLYLGLFALLPLLIACCAVESNITMVSDTATAAGQKRSASMLKNHERRPWPPIMHNGRYFRVVRYCYTNKATRDLLDCPFVRPAIRRWMTKLNSPGFRGTNNLAFEEAQVPNPNPALRLAHYCFDDQNRWNIQHVPYDTLWIHWDPNVLGGLTTAGYRGANGPGQNRMSLNMVGSSPDDDFVAVVVHEFGHVLGMLHEQQRGDRDDYIRFNCRNIEGFDETFAQAKQDLVYYKDDAVERLLCNDKDFAAHYNFPSTAFVKEPQYDEDDGFDYDSIMLYASETAARPECLTNLQMCTMQRYQTRGGVVDKSLPLELLPQTRFSSDGDARWVAKYYY